MFIVDAKLGVCGPLQLIGFSWWSLPGDLGESWLEQHPVQPIQSNPLDPPIWEQLKFEPPDSHGAGFWLQLANVPLCICEY